MKRDTLTDRELRVMSVLWAGGEALALGSIVDALKPGTNWSRNTVLTYLTRMERKGLVAIDKSAAPHRYRAAVSRDSYTAQARKSLLDRVYQGSAFGLMSAFLQEGGNLTAEERDELRKLLDDMEV